MCGRNGPFQKQFANALAGITVYPAAKHKEWTEGTVVHPISKKSHQKWPDSRWTTLHSMKTFTEAPACHDAFHEFFPGPPWRHGPFHEKLPRTPWRHGPFHEKCPRTPVAEWSIPICFPAGPPFGMVHSVSFSPPEHPPGLVHPRELSGGMIMDFSKSKARLWRTFSLDA